MDTIFVVTQMQKKKGKKLYRSMSRRTDVKGSLSEANHLIANAVQKVHTLSTDDDKLGTLHKNRKLMLSSSQQCEGSEKNRFWCVSGSEKSRLCVCSK